eukprot:1724265-Pleurochrysis_carterae.AAC.1
MSWLQPCIVQCIASALSEPTSVADELPIWSEAFNDLAEQSMLLSLTVPMCVHLLKLQMIDEQVR